MLVQCLIALSGNNQYESSLINLNSVKNEPWYLSISTRPLQSPRLLVIQCDVLTSQGLRQLRHLGFGSFGFGILDDVGVNLRKMIVKQKRRSELMFWLRSVSVNRPICALCLVK